MAKEVNARDAKIIQYLNEAYGKEKQLETGLEAHIALTTRPPYRKRLQQHLKETKAHARLLERRIKKLGGTAEAGVTEAVATAAGKAVAAAQGPLHALRGTGEAEKMLKNAKDEYHEEAQEIAGYTAIEALAESVGDKDTAKLARGIRREEERMLKFLERLIPQLTKAVVKEEIPAGERGPAAASRRSRSSSSRSTTKASASRAKTKAPARGKAKASSARSTTKASATRSRKKSSPSRNGSKPASARSRKSSSSSRSGTRSTARGRSRSSS